MKKISFREALELFGDMLNQEADRLQTSPDSILAKIMEYGPDGAAIREDVRSKVFMALYKVEPAALAIGYSLETMADIYRNAIIAAHVMRDLRTDRQRAEKCNCNIRTYETRIYRGRKELKQKYLRLTYNTAIF